MASCEADARDALRERDGAELDRDVLDEARELLVVERALLEPDRAFDEPDRELLLDPRPVEVRGVRVLDFDCVGMGGTSLV